MMHKILFQPKFCPLAGHISAASVSLAGQESRTGSTGAGEDQALQCWDANRDAARLVAVSLFAQ